MCRPINLHAVMPTFGIDGGSVTGDVRCCRLRQRKATGANSAHSATGAWHHHALWPRCDNRGRFDRVGAAHCPNTRHSFCFRFPCPEPGQRWEKICHFQDATDNLHSNRVKKVVLQAALTLHPNFCVGFTGGYSGESHGSVRFPSNPN